MNPNKLNLCLKKRNHSSVRFKCEKFSQRRFIYVPGCDDGNMLTLKLIMNFEVACDPLSAITVKSLYKIGYSE